MPKRARNVSIFAGCLIIGTLLGSAGAYALGPQFEEPEAQEDFSGARYAVAGLYTDSVTKLPQELSDSEIAQTIQADSVRLLRADSDVSTFVSLDDRGALCLIVFRSGTDWAAGTACSGPEQFNARGLGVRLTTPEGISEQYLLPPTALRTAGDLAESGILAVDPDLSSEARESMSSTVGIDLMGAPRYE